MGALAGLLMMIAISASALHAGCQDAPLHQPATPPEQAQPWQP